jgi:hypothetical protein
MEGQVLFGNFSLQDTFGTNDTSDDPQHPFQNCSQLIIPCPSNNHKYDSTVHGPDLFYNLSLKEEVENHTTYLQPTFNNICLLLTDFPQESDNGHYANLWRDAIDHMSYSMRQLLHVSS